MIFCVVVVKDFNSISSVVLTLITTRDEHFAYSFDSHHCNSLMAPSYSKLLAEKRSTLIILKFILQNVVIEKAMQYIYTPNFRVV